MEQKQKLGKEPAFPDPSRGMEQSISNQTPWANPEGMSKRFYAACAAMQGLLSNSLAIDSEFDNICKAAFMAADELLKQENE